jgi:Leucine-rich repeat (LRR) protein
MAIMINITSLVAEIAERAVETLVQEPNVYLVASVGLAAIACLTAYFYNEIHTQRQPLYLSGNQLAAQPDIRQNPRLRTLDLSDNDLVASPDVSQNAQLQTLNLSNNQLAAPPDVSQHTELQTLDLSDNQLIGPCSPFRSIFYATCRFSRPANRFFRS